MATEIWLIRHGETAWSKSGAHTGRTDIPLTDEGRRRAKELRGALAGYRFSVVLVSPMQRARETCALAGFGDVAQIDPNLCEWNYGDYEGKSTADIRKQRPNWNLWKDGVVNGETVEQVGVRASAVIARVKPVEGAVALFAHGHILRILTACWLGLPPDAGRLFAFDTGAMSELGFERETQVITRWNHSYCL